jgi:hypothetical protein
MGAKWNSVQELSELDRRLIRVRTRVDQRRGAADLSPWTSHRHGPRAGGASRAPREMAVDGLMGGSQLDFAELPGGEIVVAQDP